MTVPGVQKLAEYARAGLPIIISGGLPTNVSGHNDSSSAFVAAALASISVLENVHQVPFTNLSTSLRNLGFLPRARVEANRIWYSSWREHVEANKTYIFVYNDAWDSPLGGGSSNGSVTFASTGVPYLYDAWTGVAEAITVYQQMNESTTIPLSLAGNQSTIIGFHHNESATHASYLATLPKGAYGSFATSDGQLMLQVGHQPGPTVLDNGTQLLLPSAPAPFMLTPWTLIVESWTPPDDIYGGSLQSTKTNSTYSISEIQPWRDISQSLFNVSGRGFYNTTFNWPPVSGEADGALLDFGVIANTGRVWVNGYQLPPLDPTKAVADMSKYLLRGENEILVVVATTLGNAARLHWANLRTSGTLASSAPLPLTQDYGLISEVFVKPYVEIPTAV